MLLRHIVICFLPRSTNFSTFSHKGHDFLKKKLFNKNVYWDFLYKFVWNIYHSKKNWERYDQKYNRSTHKVPLIFLSDFNETRIFPTDRRKILELQISYKSVQRESRSFTRTVRQTDMKLTVAFREFANATKFLSICKIILH